MNERERRDMFAAAIAAAIIGTSKPGDGGADDCDFLSSENINHDGHPVNKEGDVTHFDVALRWIPKAAYLYVDAMESARGPDALGLTDAPTPTSGCYAIPKEVCEAFDRWYVGEGLHGAKDMLDAIRAARKP